MNATACTLTRAGATPFRPPADHPARPGDDRSRRLEVAPVDDPDAQRQVGALLSERYRRRGYACPGLPDPPRDGPRTHHTLGLRNGTRWIATLTVAWGCRAPLASQALFPRAVQELRDQGRSLCEFMRLAAADDGAGGRDGASPRPATGAGGVRRLLPLFGAAVRAALQAGCDLALMEVHPRHVGFYRRCAGARVLHGPRHHEAVGAPAVLMALDLRDALSRMRFDGPVAGLRA